MFFGAIISLMAGAYSILSLAPS